MIEAASGAGHDAFAEVKEGPFHLHHDGEGGENYKISRN
jgi:hypothetical protein